MLRKHFIAFLVLASATGMLSAARAQEALPRWEAGVALGVYNYPDWRGAEHRNSTVLPLPYLIYRGDRVRLARDGLKIRLLDSDRVSLNLAAAFALAGDAANNPLREGMPKLLSTFDAGPVLNVNLNASEESAIRWDFRLPVYLVAATDFRRFEAAGVTALPQIRGRYDRFVHDWFIRFGGSVGTQFANEQNNDYFYQVRPSEARASRPAFDAKAGYGGAVANSYVAAVRGRWGYGLYARYDVLNGATFEDSPLVQTKSFWSAGVGLTYRFYQSDHRAPPDATE